ncbi:class F sortase [Actinophytocola sediminis]
MSARHAATAVVLAMVATCGGTVAIGGAGPESVAGAATATPVRMIGDPGGPPGVTPTAPPTPIPAPTPTPTPTPPRATEHAPEPAPRRAQAAGTVRLAEGGTAVLVRAEVLDGVLPVPDDLGEATWWGADPGAGDGATVLAGHVNWNGAVGPFAELWRARTGDLVTVVDQAGDALGYEVTDVLTLDKDELPQRAAQLFDQAGAHRLVLVTCGGRWVGGTSGYADNRVVIATRR